MLEEFSVDVNVNMIFNNDEHNTLVAQCVCTWSYTSPKYKMF